jgi:hypothetical protein
MVKVSKMIATRVTVTMEMLVVPEWLVVSCFNIALLSNT